MNESEKEKMLDLLILKATGEISERRIGAAQKTGRDFS